MRLRLISLIFLLYYGYTCFLSPAEAREIVLHPKSDLNIDLSTQEVNPGDTVIIPAGTYHGITLFNFHGTAENPVLIRNSHEGQVVAPYFRVHRATHFILSGSGSTNQFGFLLGSRSSNACVGISQEVSDFEVEHLECVDSTCGLLFKVNPKKDNPLTIHPNWVMDNVKIHDTYIHNVHGEGMYIGHTGHNGGQSKNPLIPIRLNHVCIHDNLVENTDWDGIQLATARDNAEIYNNIIKNYGVENKATQQAGIIVGACTSGKVHDNWIEEGTGNGIEFFGYGTAEIANNTLINAGIEKNDTIFVNQVPNKVEKDDPLSISITNNRIVQKSLVAIRNANYHKNETAGKISDNKIWISGDTNQAELIRSNCKDVIEDNIINPTEAKPVSKLPQIPNSPIINPSAL